MAQQLTIESGLLLRADLTGEKTLNIPDEVTAIAADALYGIKKLVTVHIGSGLVNVDGGISRLLAGCESLESVTVATGNREFADFDGALYDAERSRLLFVPCKRYHFTVPGTVTAIADTAIDADRIQRIGYIQAGPDTFIAGWARQRGIPVIPPEAHISKVDERALTTFRFRDDGTELTITTFIGSKGDVAIPKAVGIRPVTAIQADAFPAKGRSVDIKHLVIPPEVARIEEGAFGFRYGDEAVVVVEPGSAAEAYFKSLTDSREFWLVYPDEDRTLNLTTLRSLVIERRGDSLSISFKHYISMKRVDIPASLAGTPITEVDLSRDGLPRGAQTLHIPASVKSIRYSDMSFCNDLCEVSIDEGNAVYRTDGKVLYSKDGKRLLKALVRNMDEYDIPEGTVSIESNAFACCSALAHVKLSRSLENTGKDAFAHTPYQKSLDAAVMRAKYEAYEQENRERKKRYEASPEGQAELRRREEEQRGEAERKRRQAEAEARTHVVIPEGSFSVSRSDLKDSYNLKTIDIPASVSHIDFAAFGANLQSVNVHEDNATFASVDGVVYSKDLRRLLYAPRGRQYGDFTIPQTVETVCAEAFANCRGLTHVYLQEGLKCIENRAFCGCKLAPESVPASVTHIGRGAFYGCTDITVYDTIDPDAKPAMEGVDANSGKANSDLGLIGVSTRYSDDRWDYYALEWSNNHTIRVRSHETGGILYEVPMVIDRSNSGYRTDRARRVMISGWGCNASFAFDEMDRSFAQIRSNVKSDIALARLRYRYQLTTQAAKPYKSYCTAHADEIARRLIDEGTLADYEDLKLIKKSNADALIDYANGAGNTAITAYLIDYKNAHFKAATAAEMTDDPFGTFDLGDLDDFDEGKEQTKRTQILERLWEYEQVANGLAKIKRYKGEETDIIFPVEIAGLKVIGTSDLAARNSTERYQRLHSAIIPEGYVSLGDRTFAGCANLESVTLPHSLTSIGEAAFLECEKLTSLTIPAGVPTLPYHALSKCYSLRELVTLNPALWLGDAVLYGCGRYKVYGMDPAITAIERKRFYAAGEFVPIGAEERLGYLDVYFPQGKTAKRKVVTQFDYRLTDVATEAIPGERLFIMTRVAEKRYRTQQHSYPALVNAAGAFVGVPVVGCADPTRLLEAGYHEYSHVVWEADFSLLAFADFLEIHVAGGHLADDGFEVEVTRK